MPRRYPDYPAAFAGWNLVSSIGAYLAGVAPLECLYVVFRTFTSKEHLAENYWGEGATTLEWSVSCHRHFTRTNSCRASADRSRATCRCATSSLVQAWDRPARQIALLETRER